MWWEDTVVVLYLCVLLGSTGLLRGLTSPVLYQLIVPETGTPRDKTGVYAFPCKGPERWTLVGPI